MISLRAVSKTRRAFVGGILGTPLLPTVASTQPKYPSRTVRIIVPFPPGGGADLIARLLSPHLHELLGQPFVVENRAGAAGRIGTALAAKADADGYTLLMTTESSLVIAPHMGVSMVYDPREVLAPISLLTRNPIVLVVHPSLPAHTLAQYMELARRSAVLCLFRRRRSQSSRR